MSRPGTPQVLGNNDHPQHPWSKIISETPINQQTYRHDTNLGTLELRGLIPPADRDTDEKAASYYKAGAQIEQAYHYILLPYLITLDPRVHSNSFDTIRDESYDTWARRVVQYRCTIQPTPAKLKALTDAQMKAEVQAGGHNHHLEKLARILRQRLTEDDAEYQAGDVWLKRRMEGYHLLKVLRDWTLEWQNELLDHEAIHGHDFSSKLVPAAPKDAPYPVIETGRTRK